MLISALTTHRVVETTSDIKYVVVGDVVVYEKTSTTKTLGKEPVVSVTEGTTSWGGLTAFDQGAATIPDYAPGKVALVATRNLRDLLRTHGWCEDTFAAIRDAIKNPYTRITSGQAYASDVLILQGQEKVTDTGGHPVPIAVHFDYINGHVDNAGYDLERALTILKARPDIRFPSGDDRAGRPGTVLAIPHYNADQHRNCFLRFVWVPTDEDFRRLHEALPKSPALFEPHKTIFDLDLLGLRAGGAALFDDFYERRKSE